MARPRRSSGTALAAFVMAMVGLVGCTTAELDIDDLQSSLATRLEDRLGERPDLECPVPPAPLQAGDTVTCRATFGRSTMSVMVELTQEQQVADAVVLDRLMAGDSLETLVADRLESEIGSGDVDCGAAVVALDEFGESKACVVTDATGTSRGLTIRVDDEGVVDVGFAVES